MCKNAPHQSGSSPVVALKSALVGVSRAAPHDAHGSVMTQRLKRKSRAATQDEPEDVEEGARASRAKVAKRDKAPAKRERRESEVEAGGGRGGRASARAARAAPAAPTTVNLVDEDEDEDEFDVKPEIGFEQLVRASRARRRRLPRGASSRVVRRVPSFSSIDRSIDRTNDRR